MYQFIGFLSFSYVGLTLINRLLEGAFLTTADVSVINTLSITHSQEIFGLFTVPIINTDFFFEGIPSIAKFDYSFFGGNATIFAYILYSLTFALTFMLFIAIIGMVSQYFARR